MIPPEEAMANLIASRRSRRRGGGGGGGTASLNAAGTTTTTTTTNLRGGETGSTAERAALIVDGGWDADDGDSGCCPAAGVSTVLNAAAVCGLVFAPYTLLVQVTVMLLTPVFLVFIAAYVKIALRTPPPGRTEFGRVVIPTAWSFGPTACVLTNLAFGLMDTTSTFGVPCLPGVALGTMLVLGAVGHVVVNS